MKLSKNSWHYKLNRLYTYNVAKNLCGYFWRTVWYIIVLLPTILLFIPYWIVNLISTLADEHKQEDTETLTYQYPEVIVIDAAIVALYCMIRMWFVLDLHAVGPNAAIIVLGGIGWMIVFVFVYTSLEKRWKKNREHREKKPNILIEYIKAKKKKYCPIIEWHEEEKHEGA